MKNILVSLALAVSVLPWWQWLRREKYQAGKHYQVLAVPVRTANPDKIEVNEVFWYGCSHCFEFETLIEPWAKNLPPDVDFERTPAIWQPKMEAHARAYYAAKQLNVLDSMHPIIFKTMHVEKHPLENEDQLASLFLWQMALMRRRFAKPLIHSQCNRNHVRVIHVYVATALPEPRKSL